MRSVLGIDAAWTSTQPSGVALIQESLGRWQVLCVAPSYDSFLSTALGGSLNWDARRFDGSEPDILSLLEAARVLGATTVDIIAMDIPLARKEITTRRPSDSAISKAFGGKGCSAHSPNSTRPGPISNSLARQLKSNGFELETTVSASKTVPRAIEVYPHPALLTLLNRDYRVPYKVGNSSKYWRGESVRQRIARLIDEFTYIYNRLAEELGNFPFDLPSPSDVYNLNYLKRYEDALDALVCAWVGQQHLLGQTTAYGNHDSAIWVPGTREDSHNSASAGHGSEVRS